MRLFISINFDKDTADKLAKIQARLKKPGRGRFPDPGSFHMTLVFLGETPDDLVPVIEKILETVRVPETVIRFTKAGAFGRRAGVVWAGTEKNELLSALREEIAKKLEAAGIPFEKGDFTPHVTLARGMELKEEDKSGLLAEPFECRISSFSLMRSDPGKGRQVYTEICRFPKGKKGKG